MTQKHVVLKEKEHGDYRVAETHDWRFVGKEMFIPVNVTELGPAAREYPLFFVKDMPGIFALTGVEKNVNAYVAEDGSWRAQYIPARLRAHPFLMTSPSKKSGDYVLAIKVDAPEINAAKGNKLFINGVPSDFVKQRANLLASISKATAVTQKIEKLISSFDLLDDISVQVKFKNGSAARVVGLRRVNEKKLSALPQTQFMQLRDQGALPVIYAHLLSMANLNRGVLADRYPSLRQPSQINNEASDIVELD